MVWPITVAGTVHLNDIATPHGHRAREPGGSAVYFALAASPFVPVHVAAIAGSDCESTVRSLFMGRPIVTDDMRISTTPAHHWKVVHDFTRWVPASEATLVDGCDALWDGHLGPVAARSPVLFLGSMLPRLQARVLEQSSALLIGADSMTEFIGPQRDAVQSVAHAVDILFLNRTELAALLPSFGTDWRPAALSLLGRSRLRAVVVKAGPDGAAVVTAERVTEMPAEPVEQVVDPTGAGDALAAGFLGACARAQRSDTGYFAEALESGMRSASRAIAHFGCVGLAAEPA